MLRKPLLDGIRAIALYEAAKGAIVAGALYVPVEVYHLWHRFTWLKVAVLGANLAVVAVMAFALRHRAEQERELADRSAIV